MILIIDNYDSFVHNLARYCHLTGWINTVVRNDKITVQQVRKINPRAIILSPGPCTPTEAGICVDLIRELGHLIPILGVCLGHQCIGEAYGARTVRAAQPVHGRSTSIQHGNKGLFQNIPSPMKVGRYHSLVIDGLEMSELNIDARTSEGEIMAVSHAHFPVYGVQFHPESILTERGHEIMKNFKTLAEDWHDMFSRDRSTSLEKHISHTKAVA